MKKKCASISFELGVTFYSLYYSYLLTYLLTELIHSWEAANCAAIQEFPAILRNSKVHRRVHKSPQSVLFKKVNGKEDNSRDVACLDIVGEQLPLHS
jgi:hypothetical protein